MAGVCSVRENSRQETTTGESSSSQVRWGERTWPLPGLVTSSIHQVHIWGASILCTSLNTYVYLYTLVAFGDFVFFSLLNESGIAYKWFMMCVEANIVPVHEWMWYWGTCNTGRGIGYNRVGTLVGGTNYLGPVFPGVETTSTWRSMYNSLVKERWCRALFSIALFVEDPVDW